MNILNYLEVAYDIVGIDPEEDGLLRIVHEIIEVKENIFCPEEYQDSKQWVLNLRCERKEEGLDWVPSGWRDWDERLKKHLITQDHPPLRFFMTSRTEPTIEDFSLHIYDSCHAVAAAFDYDFGSSMPPYHDRVGSTQIQFTHVYRYMIELGVKCFETEDFLRQYDHYWQCLYGTQKWMHYMLGNISTTHYALPGWHYVCIGSLLLDFLLSDIED
jgi:hypothetical protein